MPGLDGLRGLAILAVLIYHLNPHVLPGGYLGVDVFFVVSGYLITSVLLDEMDQSRGFQLRRFWARRARRLLPALVAVLVVVTLGAAIFARDALNRMRADALSSLFYVFNWRLVAQHDSYLASLGRPPLLLHLWSLSVEEQFYLLWPLALLFLRRRVSRERLATLALGGAALSALLMAVLYSPGNPSAVYFGTETHGAGLLAGAMLAAAVPPRRMSSDVSARAARAVDRTGLAALAVVVFGVATLGFNSALTYRGGMLLVDLAAVVLVAVAAHPISRLGARLSRQPWRWLGLRSYSLYLWHWPIFEMTRPGIDVHNGAFATLVLRLVLTGAAAELSYRFVEQPWRSGQAQAAFRVAWTLGKRGRFGWALVVPVVAVAAVLATAPAPAAPAILAEGSTAAARTWPFAPGLHFSSPAHRGRIGPQLAPLPSNAGSTSTTSLAGTQSTSPTTATSTTAPAPTASGLPILAIGDSVLLATSPSLQAAFGPQITIDAVVGRQVSDGLSRLAAYRASNALARYRTVVIDLGTNGAFEPVEFDQLAQLVAGVPQVILFDVHADRPWAAESNATIIAGVAAHSAQMRMVDWNGAATNPSLLYSDGIHPNSAGTRLYTQLLDGALTKQ